MKTLKNSLILLAMVLVSSTASAQLRFIVQNADGPQVYGTFTAALAAIQHGDTLYLPGGNFNAGNISINKKITLIGAGHYPEYSEASGRTLITGNITLLEGADSSQFHGFYLSGNIQWGSTPSNQTVNKVTISRCNVSDIRLNYGGGSPSTSEQILISENVVRGSIVGRDAQNVLIEKNIVNNIGYFNNNLMITNNVIFVKPGNFCLEYITSSTIQNNVIMGGGIYLFYSSSANTVQNNLFVSAYSAGTDNIDKQEISTIFMNYSGDAFSYDHDFHIKESSPGKGAGTDGTDIGIYGTITPYKNGAVPFNPHITDEEIATRTDSQGKLHVKVSVEAQNQ